MIHKQKNVIQEKSNNNIFINFDFNDNNPTQDGFVMDNRWNSLLIYDNKLYRERVETIIFRNGKIFLAFKDKDNYKIPGGSTEPDISISQQLQNECNEEARIKISNPQYIGTYIKLIPKNSWMVKKFPADKRPVGSIIHLFISFYDDKYTGYIENIDKDEDIIRYGKFYDVAEIYDKLSDVHKYAINNFSNIYTYKKENGYYVINEPIQETRLTTKERNALKDKEFGLPSKRKYPLNDKDHVLEAIRFFNHCPDEDRDELAANIIKAINKFFTDKEKLDINVGENNSFKDYWSKPEKINESLNNTNCIIVSCFAGVGKNFAISYFKKNGYKVYSIEKEKDFYKKYPNPEVDLVEDIKSISKKYDILFIPYYFEMEKRHLKGQIDYYLIYPNLHDKNLYINRFKELQFTEEQIAYFKKEFKNMINDCDSCNISENRKIKLNKNEYCLDAIIRIINNKDIDSNSIMEYNNIHKDSSVIIQESKIKMTDIINITKKIAYGAFVVFVPGSCIFLLTAKLVRDNVSLGDYDPRDIKHSASSLFKKYNDGATEHYLAKNRLESLSSNDKRHAKVAITLVKAMKESYEDMNISYGFSSVKGKFDEKIRLFYIKDGEDTLFVYALAKGKSGNDKEICYMIPIFDYQIGGVEKANIIFGYTEEHPRYKKAMGESTIFKQEEYIEESKKVERLFKCPYCNTKKPRAKLPYHIDKHHSNMVPQNMTSAQVVFNHINKKDHGTCTICGKETKWREDVWRYDRFCSSKCKEIYVKTMKERMINKYGKPHLLNDMEQQSKMLSNRSISGKYKFKDGGIRTYCGSYEKKLLEFYDQVLNVKSDDIMTPGPIIEYEWNGETHKFITDLYYIPANLVHDVKDGGDNPNTRPMDDYRDKQIAKEKAIMELGKFNYIRLTNNDFKQLMLILADIKESMMNDDHTPIFSINEYMAMAGMNPMIGMNRSYYIVPTEMNNSFTGVYVSKDKDIRNAKKIKDGKVTKEKINTFDDGEVDSVEEGYNKSNNATDKYLKYSSKLKYKSTLSSNYNREANNLCKVVQNIIDIVISENGYTKFKKYFKSSIAYSRIRKESKLFRKSKSIVDIGIYFCDYNYQGLYDEEVEDNNISKKVLEVYDIIKEEGISLLKSILPKECKVYTVDRDVSCFYIEYPLDSVDNIKESYSMYEYNGNLKDIIEEIEFMSPLEFELDNRFTPVLDVCTEAMIKSSIERESIIYEVDKLNNKNISFDIKNSTKYNIDGFREDINGVYAYKGNKRTPSFESVDMIPDEYLLVLQNM